MPQAGTQVRFEKWLRHATWTCTDTLVVQCSRMPHFLQLLNSSQQGKLSNTLLDVQLLACSAICTSAAAVCVAHCPCYSVFCCSHTLTFAVAVHCQTVTFAVSINIGMFYLIKMTVRSELAVLSNCSSTFDLVSGATAVCNAFLAVPSGNGTQANYTTMPNWVESVVSAPLLSRTQRATVYIIWNTTWTDSQDAGSSPGPNNTWTDSQDPSH